MVRSPDLCSDDDTGDPSRQILDGREGVFVQCEEGLGGFVFQGPRTSSLRSLGFEDSYQKEGHEGTEEGGLLHFGSPQGEDPTPFRCPTDLPPRTDVRRV